MSVSLRLVTAVQLRAVLKVSESVCPVALLLIDEVARTADLRQICLRSPTCPQVGFLARGHGAAAAIPFRVLYVLSRQSTNDRIATKERRVRKGFLVERREVMSS